MKYKFNDQQGNRDRQCRFAIIHDGKLYQKDDAVTNRLATFQALDHEKAGKWSNTTWQVTVNTASLIVCMSPFEGWPGTMELCIKHIQGECKMRIGYTPTAEEAELFFAEIYPERYARVRAAEEAVEELI